MRQPSQNDRPEAAGEHAVHSSDLFRLRVALDTIELIATPGKTPLYMEGKGLGAKLDEISRIAHQALAVPNDRAERRREEPRM